MNKTQDKLEGIYRTLSTDPNIGLTSQQAREVQKEKGLNKFDDEKKETVAQKILYHLKDITSLILLIAVAISLILAVQSGHGYTDAIIIMAIIILNLVLAVRQEMGAEKALDALKNLNAQMTVVIRNGVQQQGKRMSHCVDCAPCGGGCFWRGAV